MSRAQFEGLATATRAIDATLYALAQALPTRVTQDVARQLPPEMGAAMLSARGTGAASVGDFYGRIGERAGLSLSWGLEQAQIVCSVLAEQLEPTLIGRMSRELPDDIAALLSPPSHEHRAPLHAAAGHGHSLADGKPGGTHPLSEASPGSLHPLSDGRPSTAHTHSVSEADPHQDSKVSSARGLTQEREHETLAEGHGNRS